MQWHVTSCLNFGEDGLLISAVLVGSSHYQGKQESTVQSGINQGSTACSTITERQLQLLKAGQHTAGHVVVGGEAVRRLVGGGRHRLFRIPCAIESTNRRRAGTHVDERRRSVVLEEKVSGPRKAVANQQDGDHLLHERGAGDLPKGETTGTLHAFFDVASLDSRCARSRQRRGGAQRWLQSCTRPQPGRCPCLRGHSGGCEA